MIRSTSRLAASTSLAFVLLATGALTACSSGGSKAQAANTPAPAASPSGSRSAGGFNGGRANLFSDPKIKQCLTAAGISVPTRAAGARPSGSTRPSFTPGQRPSGAAGGGFGDSAQSAKIEAALKACGLSLPSFSRPGASPSATAAT